MERSVKTYFILGFITFILDLFLTFDIPSLITTSPSSIPEITETFPKVSFTYFDISLFLLYYR